MEVSTSSPASPAVSRPHLKLIFASSFGALLEWYDFYIYASLAGSFGAMFFPHGNATAAFLASLATFGAGFLVRPIGAMLFGRLGDMIGRKHTFIVTIGLMGISTIGVGLLPSYQEIGIAAPVLLVGLRLLQGLALGGETGGAATYLAEHAPGGRRGYFTSSLQASATLGLLASIGVVSLTRASMDVASFQAWGWRVPFLVSLFLLMMSMYLRTKLAESPTFVALKTSGRLSGAPLAESFLKWDNLRYVLVMLLSTASGVGVIFGTSEFYSMYFVTNTLKVPSNLVSAYLSIALVLSMPCYLFFGWLSDRIGRKWIMMLACMGAVLTIQPIFHGLAHFANADLEAFQRSSPVIVHANDCHFSLFSAPATDCDRIRSLLTSSGVSYQHTSLAPGAPATTSIGGVTVAGSDPAVLTRALVTAGWSDHADPAKIDGPAVVFLMWLLLLYLTMIYGPMAAFMVELFPARIRYTSLSLPFHLGAGWFGGMLPFVVSAMAVAHGNIYYGLWYPVVVAAVSLIVGVLFVPETYRRDVAA
ncbi:MFS transporter [Burkholderia cenocepacia]|nr:MFS transporter [Burkholderia cenocepacia]